MTISHNYVRYVRHSFVYISSYKYKHARDI